MNPMNCISKTYTHPVHGALRTIYDGDMLYLCVRDIGTVLGYREPVKSVRYHCPGMKKFPYAEKGLETASEMYFINAEEADHLLTHTESHDSISVAHWICEDIIPDILGEKLPDANVDSKPGVFIIHAQDYCNYVRDLFTMCHYLRILAEAAKNLPDIPGNRYLRRYARMTEKLCAETIGTYGFDFNDLETINSEKLDALFAHDVITPAEAGYLTPEQVTEAVETAVSDLLDELLGDNG